MDLSHLTLHGVYLQGLELQDATLSGAMLRECVLSETFDAIRAVATSRSGQYWAAASQRGEVRVWREAGQTLHLVWQAHTDIVWSLAFSPDERTLASGSWDRALKLWDVESRALLWTGWQTKGPICLAFSPDGSLLASSGWDNAIRLWDPATGTCVQVLRDLDHPETAFFGVAWSPDGQLLACGTYQRGLQVWDVAARSLRWADRAHVTWIRRVAWSPDGSRLASGGGSRDAGELVVWNAHSGQRHPAWEAGSSALAGHPGVVSALTWAPSGELVVSGGSDGRLRWWNVQSGECVRVQEAHQGMVQALKVSPDGGRLASCGDDGAITLWDLERREHLRTLRRDRPYERLNITGIQGLSAAQKASLRALGAFEETSVGG